MHTAGDVCRSLLDAGIIVSPAEVRVEARDDEPWVLHARAKADAKLAARIGAQLGRILAEQHTRVAASDAASWLPSRPHWPEPSAWIRERIPRVTADRRLFDDVSAMLARHDAIVVDERDRVLVHGDIGLHNIAVDPETCDVQGVFDYKDAAWADRHHDFRYLLFDDEREDMLEAALAVYQPMVSRRLSRARIALANAASAASFLAFRDGVPPDQKWCGRTLEQDLAWTRASIDRWAKLPDDAPRTTVYAVLRGPLRFDDGTTLDDAMKQMAERARFGKVER